jgi:hypothetical protein
MNGAARFLKWLAAYPNARLALLGLSLILLGVGVGKTVEGLGKLLVSRLTEPTPGSNAELYLGAYAIGALVISIIMLACVFAGMTLIPFAAYRAVRDSLARKSAD